MPRDKGDKKKKKRSMVIEDITVSDTKDKVDNYNYIVLPKERPRIERYIFNRYNMPLLVEINGKESVMLCPRNYWRLEEEDKLSNSTSKLFSMGHLIIIAKTR